jgi:hypothetical protein
MPSPTSAHSSDVNNDGVTGGPADVLLTLIDKFLGSTMSFSEAEAQGLITKSMDFSFHALGLGPDDTVFFANHIGADEVFAFKGVSPADFQAELFHVFDFGLTPQDFANFNLSPADIIHVGAQHGVTLDLTGLG